MTLAPLAAAAQTQGVSKDEIVVGTIQDLSGPLAALGTHFRNSLQMRFDEVNAEGGIHGRKIKLVAEDSGYDPKKGVLAAQKLIQRDKVFAAVSNLGSAVVLATMPLFLERKVPHLFPATAHPSAYEPLHKYKFQNLPSYAIQIEKAAPSLIKQHGYKKVGILYQDDDFGYDVLAGTETALKSLNMAMCGKATYKRGATDFSSQVATLKGNGCDFVILGTVLRETVGVMAEARKTGWDVPMLVQAAATAPRSRRSAARRPRASTARRSPRTRIRTRRTRSSTPGSRPTSRSSTSTRTPTPRSAMRRPTSS